jgi:RNA polymerase sporulation-specific sigma factor
MLSFFIWLKNCFSKIFQIASNGEIHYINGAEILPAPLSAEEEHAVLHSTEMTDFEKRGCLIEHNLRLVVYIAKRFENTGLNIEELISIGTAGLIKAIETFQPDKNIKLATYASRCIENEILMYIRKSSNSRREVSFDEPINSDADGNELLLSDILGSDADVVSRGLEEREERRIVRLAVSRVAPRERYIIEMRYGLTGEAELTQKEVADRMGISQSYISRLEKRIMRELREELAEKI